MPEAFGVIVPSVAMLRTFAVPLPVDIVDAEVTSTNPEPKPACTLTLVGNPTTRLANGAFTSLSPKVVLAGFKM